jgi:hypothetical protein
MGLKFQHFLFLKFFWDFFENFSILEVEIGRIRPGILGVNIPIGSLAPNTYDLIPKIP